MKSVYWKNSTNQRSYLIALALLSLLAIFSTEKFRLNQEQPYYTEKMEAAKLAYQSIQRIREENILKNRMNLPEFDPANSGLIGWNLSEVTSNVGSLSAKQTSINPNWAAVWVHYLKKADLRAGDLVAVSLSGSFPALNLALFSALQTLKIQPAIISSATSSQWGANHPDFLWIDWENILYKEGYASFRSGLVTMGGIEDRGLGMTEKSKSLIRVAIRRNSLPLLEPKSFEDSLDQRLKFYDSKSKQTKKQIKCFINIGGGTIAVGTYLGKKIFRPGYLDRIPEGGLEIDSLILRFLKKDVPVIHFSEIETLAKRHGLPIQPKSIPKYGEGEIFRRSEYNPYLTIFWLVLLTIGLFFFRRKEISDSEIFL
jgi:poly-gamma-glutamate system protein